ncbi:MAG: hypothetical protein NW226_27180 [Microscillaceae bacterium]|nr:hypothetical protein [Microscillaceae bacterium]
MIVPDALLTAQQLFERPHWSLLAGTPIFMVGQVSSPGVGSFGFKGAPGFMLGVGYQYPLAAHWAVQAEVRGGLSNYLFRYDIPRQSIGSEADVSGVGSAGNAFAAFSLEAMYRTPLSTRTFLYGAGGASANFHIKELIQYVRPDSRIPEILQLSLDYLSTPNPSFTPYLKLGAGRILANGSALSLELVYQQGLSQIFQGRYSFNDAQSGNSITGGQFDAKDSALNLQLRYTFGGAKRSLRKGY